MGQPIVVRERPSSNPGTVRFETNRAFTGMGHEYYPSPERAVGERPPDELARRLFAHGGVDTVHINGNVVTVHLADGATSDGLAVVIEQLYLFYPDADGSSASGATDDSDADDAADGVDGVDVPADDA